MEGERSRVKTLKTQHVPLQDLDEIVSRFVTAFPDCELQVFLKENDEPQLQWVAGAFGSNVEARSGCKEVDALLRQALADGQMLLCNESEQPLARVSAALEAVVRAFVPIKVRNSTVGLLESRCSPFGAFTSKCVTYLQTVASYMGIALHAQLLIDEARQRTMEVGGVAGASEPARVLTPLYPALVEICAQIVRDFKPDSFFIALYNRDQAQISFPLALEAGEEVQLEPVSIENDESLVAWVIRHRQPYVTGNWVHERPVPGISLAGSASQSVLCFPLFVASDLVGALSMQSDRPHAFDDHEITLLASIADHIAVIVQNSRIYSNTQVLVDNMAREYLAASNMRQAVSAMGTSLDLDVILQRFMLATKDVVPYDSATLVLMRDDRLVFHKHVPYSDVPEGTVLKRSNRQLLQSPLIERVVQEREPLVIDDVQEHPEWITVEGLEYVRSWAAVPMLAGNELVGILTLDSTRPGAYKQRELWLVSTLASHASLSLQNARLHVEIQSQVHELTTLYEAGAAINADLDRDTVLRTVVDEMVRALDVDLCAILMKRPEEGLRVAIARSLASQSNPQYGHGRSYEADDFTELEEHSTIRRVFAEGIVLNLHAGGELQDEESSLLAASGVLSMLLVPFVQGERSLGVLLLGRTSASADFSERDIRLARNLAGQAAAAIEHAHLYTQAQRRIGELSTFHQIVLQLNTPLELEVVLENITEAALKLVQANNLHIYLWDEGRDEFTFCSALWRDGSRVPAVEAPRKDGLTASVVHSGEAIIIDNANRHPLYLGNEAGAWGVQAIAGFPLKHAGRVIGAFTMAYVEPHVFTPDERLLMNLLADQAATAVENARLFSDAQQRLRSMSALVDMAKQVTGNLRVELVLQTTVQTLQKLLRARASTIALFSDDEKDLIVEAAAGIKPQYHRVRIKLGEGVSGRAVSERRMIYIRDTYREPDFLFFDDVLRSLLVVPLITRNKVIGTLTVDSDRPQAFSDSDTQMLTIAAAQVSVAIANARLFEALEDRAAELAVAYEELKENDRLKDELVQNVSHELRTPLTFIRGYVDLLVDGEMGELSPEQQRALNIVADKTGEITRLVEDIMSLQRIDSANLMRQQFSLSTLLESAVDLHKLSASKRGLSLVFRAPATEGIVEADRGRMNQVLDNLIGNAMKFSPDGGTIELRMVERQQDVLIVVADEGIGVPQEKVNRIFDRFYQIDGSSRRRFGGAGIGLAIVKRIIDAHQGDIWVKSEVGAGSSFYFTVPKAPVTTELRKSATAS